MKKFKQWEKKFTQAELSRARVRWMDGPPEPLPVRWDMSVDVWPQSQVQYSVYDAEDASEWQLFRTALKGMSTSEKLYALKRYYIVNCYYETKNKTEWELHKVRIDNYILALRRGGQLDENYEVAR